MQGGRGWAGSGADLARPLPPGQRLAGYQMWGRITLGEGGCPAHGKPFSSTPGPACCCRWFGLQMWPGAQIGTKWPGAGRLVALCQPPAYRCLGLRLPAGWPAAPLELTAQLPRQLTTEPPLSPPASGEGWGEPQGSSGAGRERGEQLLGGHGRRPRAPPAGTGPVGRPRGTEGGLGCKGERPAPSLRPQP